MMAASVSVDDGEDALGRVYSWQTTFCGTVCTNITSECYINNGWLPLCTYRKCQKPYFSRTIPHQMLQWQHMPSSGITMFHFCCGLLDCQICHTQKMSGTCSNDSYSGTFVCQQLLVNFEYESIPPGWQFHRTLFDNVKKLIKTLLIETLFDLMPQLVQQVMHARRGHTNY